VLAFALTGHKVQGQTLKAIVIAKWDSHKSRRAAWMYVALSRVANLKSLFILSPLSTQMKTYQKRQDILDEMARLRKGLFQQTRNNLRL
jgi:UvrD-like helicase C-terminal domain